jgi:hypothetical protein
MIIALGHEAGTGKDTFVMFAIDYLRQKYKNLELNREGFADRVYDLCYSVYSWAGFRTRHYYITNPRAKEEILAPIGKTPRQCLIGVAEKVREFDPQAWLNAVFQNKPKHVKWITDLRTPEEVEVGRKLGAYLVRVQNPNAPAIQCSVSAMLRGREDVWDETLINDGTLDQWKEQAFAFCDRKVVPHIQQCLLEKR